MSVLVVGGQRLAAGLDWQRELVRGRAAGRLARQGLRPWMVEVGQQTAFVSAADNPEGSKPLAAALLTIMAESAPWAVFVEEDGGDGEKPGRVAVVRGAGGKIQPGGDTVYPSGEQAFRALRTLQSGTVAVVVTPGLVPFAPDAGVLTSERIAEGAKQAAELVLAPKGGMSVLSVVLIVLLVLAAGGGVSWWFFGDALLRMVGTGEKKVEEEPRVEAVVRTAEFLRHCQAAWDGHRVRMAGFDRLGVACHPMIVQGVSGMAPGVLAGRAVLEVHWSLREGLDPRVYVPLAQDMLTDWPKAVVDDKGTSAAFSPLPPVIELYDPETAPWTEPVAFRGRLDGALALRGFDIEYKQWGAEVEVELRTGRPLREAVAMLTAIAGLEVVSVTWSKESGWKFDVRRTRSFQLRESEFQALTRSPAAAAMRIDQGRAG